MGIINNFANVASFGAKGDGVTDDRLAIQQAIDSLPQTGGLVVFPSTTQFYAIKSENPTMHGYGIIIDKPGVTLLSYSIGTIQNPTIKLLGSIKYSFILLTKNAKAFSIKNILINCNNKTDYALFSNDWVSTNFYENAIVMFANKDGFNLRCYLTKFIRCGAYYCGQDGFSLHGIIGAVQGTSTSIDNCYTMYCSRYGYNLDTMTYSGLINCASDQCDTCYYLKQTSGIFLNACGSEASKTPIKLSQGNYTQISGFSTISLAAGTESLLNINGSAHITISGFYINGGTYKYKLYVSDGSYDVVIIDQSILKNEVNEVANGVKKVIYLS